MVLDQIPYWNIAEIKYEHRNGIQRIVIRLTDPDDADTYTRAGRSSYQYRERHTGWHFIITGGYQASVPSIHDRIRSRAKRYRGK